MKLITFLTATMLTVQIAHTFPPAPQHVLFGMIRDQYGNPIEDPKAEVILESAAGTILRGQLRPEAEPGVNYYLVVPMDAGFGNDLYKPTALRPTLPFRLKVKVGNRVYLPIEMSANFAHIGQPGEKTRINLNLGEDSDGDGIPDAWERAMAGQNSLEDFRPDGDADGDGLTNLQEYLAGTYASDPENGFTLKIRKDTLGATVLDFMAIRGRTYTVFGSDDLRQWVPVHFRFPNEDAAAAHANYSATDVQLIHVHPAEVAEQPQYRFYKLMVQ